MNYFPWSKKDGTQKYHPLISFTCFRFGRALPTRTEQFHFSFTVALMASTLRARSLRGFFTGNWILFGRYEITFLKQKGRYTKYHPLISFTCFRFGRALPTEPNSSIFLYSSFDSFKSRPEAYADFSQETGFCSDDMNYFPWNKRTVHKVPSSHILYLFQVRSGFAYRTEQFHFSFTVALMASNPGARSLRGFFHRKLDSVRSDMNYFPGNKKDGTQSTILSYPLLVSGSVRLLPAEPNSSIFLYE